MGEISRRLVWFFVVACVVAYSVFLLAGRVVNAQASEAGAPVLVRDELAPSSHNLSGMVTVPSPCHQLTVHVDSLSSHSYNLTFTTWEDPSVRCPNEQVPRHFRAALAAPAAGISFFATLDGASLPITVIPAITDTDIAAYVP